MGTLLAVLVGALVVARLLVPAESAAQGETLWIAQLWLLAGAVWAWQVVREGGMPLRVDRCDVALWVLVAGHVISALGVFHFGGQKRAAVNMLWEWIALGVSFFLLRQVVRTRSDGSRLLAIILVTVVCLTGLGLWQHYVFYPGAAREYSQRRAELDELEQAGPPASQQEANQRSRRLQELRRQFYEENIPLEGPERILFEQRLRASSEPFGTFALANTFAGVLAAWLIPALAVCFSVCRGAPKTARKEGEAGRTSPWSGRSGPWFRCVIASIVALLIGYCLVLTKSRTAWAGLLIGLGTWGSLRGKDLWQRLRGRLWRFVAGAVALIGLFGVAALSGGIDAGVVTGAGRSLQYRMEYWQASWKVIEEHPVLGVGPGNFRQHYLKHKLPESSEEISDPHNLVLGAWSSGGLVALVGLFGFWAAAAWRFRRSAHRTTDGGHLDLEEEAGLWSSLAMGAVLAFPLVLVGRLLIGEGLDLRLPVLLAGWLATAWVFGKIPNCRQVPVVVLGAGCVAVGVHLLGAGGIEMPAVVQTVLVLLTLGSVKENASEERTAERLKLSEVLLGVPLIALAVACLLTATRPEVNRRALVTSADDSLTQNGNFRRAGALYAEAAAVDPFSPVPPIRLAELHFERWQRLPGARAEDFDRAAGALQIAIELDPFNHAGYRRLGQYYAAKFEQTRRPAAAAEAAEAFRQAVDLYPHNAALRAELAEALAKSGEAAAARVQARAALRQDQINRREGHRDKYLPEQTLQKLYEMLDEPVDAPDQN